MILSKRLEMVHRVHMEKDIVSVMKILGIVKVHTRNFYLCLTHSDEYKYG